jgi:hypothetical protein
MIVDVDPNVHGFKEEERIVSALRPKRGIARKAWIETVGRGDGIRFVKISGVTNL